MFGIGGGSSRSSSQSSSLDYGMNQSQSFSDSLARSISESLGQSQGTSFGTSTQGVWNADILQKLYGDALGAAGATNAPLFQGQAAELFNSGAGFLDQLGVGAGEDYLQSRLTDTSARDEQLGALRSGLGELFRNELNPAITGRAVATGTLGGGRQGVAQGAAANAIARQYATGAADIIGRDQLARDSAAGTLGQLRTQRAATGLAGISPVMEAATAGLGARLSPYSALAGILGPAQVLTQSVSGSQQTAASQATSEQVARAVSQALGFDYDTSQYTNQSKSKDTQFSFGFG